MAIASTSGRALRAFSVSSRPSGSSSCRSAGRHSRMVHLSHAPSRAALASASTSTSSSGSSPGQVRWTRPQVEAADKFGNRGLATLVQHPSDSPSSSSHSQAQGQLEGRMGNPQGQVQVQGHGGLPDVSSSSPSSLARSSANAVAPLGSGSVLLDAATAGVNLEEDKDKTCAVIRLSDLFSIGIGPSSSHTVGPMKASHMWLQDLRERKLLDKVKKLKCALYGSLAATGRGHMTPQALLLGLEGSEPETVDTSSINPRYDRILTEKILRFAGDRDIPFDFQKDLSWSIQPLPFHPNGIRLTAFDEQGDILSSEYYYSIGGGFVVQEIIPELTAPIGHTGRNVWPYPYHDAASLEQHARNNGMSIADVAWANEISIDAPEVVEQQIKAIWGVMTACIDEGINSDQAVLPGALRLKRRAKFLYDRFMRQVASGNADTTTLGPRMPLLAGIDELSCYAIAVNEVNAAGGRVVTSPTNGAAGVIPGVLKYFLNHWPHANEGHVKEFLLTAGALGMIFKRRASISAAEGGCMAEVGVASSMAAGAVTACMGGDVSQVLQAAEMAMEHFLGLTCDPVDGLVQVPCIERNSFGAVKAVTAAQLALSGQGTHVVDLDTVIKAMRDTARDMHHHYKETSLGGLATYVNIPVSSPAC